MSKINLKLFLTVALSLLILPIISTQSYAATTITFKGTLSVVTVDHGTGAFAGAKVGDSYSGSFTYGDYVNEAYEILPDPEGTDYGFQGEPYTGCISDGTTVIGNSNIVDVYIGNDGILDAGMTDLFTQLGAPVTQASLADAWFTDSISGGAYYNNYFELLNGAWFGVGLVSYDHTLYSDSNFQVIPPNISDVNLAYFFIEDYDPSGNKVFEAYGTLDTFTVAPISGTISGTVYYDGTQIDEIHIVAVNMNNYSLMAHKTISEPGPYSFSVPSGTYFIVAQMDTNHSRSFSLNTFQQSEPSGGYDAGCGNGENEDRVVVDSSSIQNIDIYLSDYKPFNIFHDSFPADYFSGYGGDMSYHDNYLWICDQTWSENGPDILKINPANGNLVESYNLGIDHVTSIEWIGDDMWVCFKDYSQSSWVIRKYTFDGITFIPGVSYNLPSIFDWETVWSINIAWDGNLLWAQEKGHWVNTYKIDLSDGSIIETIPCDQFGYGNADTADICFSDDHLWAMDDDRPKFIMIDPVNSQNVKYTFDRLKYPIDDDGRYHGMVKQGDLFFFLQRIDTKDSEGNVVGSNYKILTASIDQCLFKTIDLDTFAANFGRTDCNQIGVCEGNENFDTDVDGLDLWGILNCQE